MHAFYIQHKWDTLDLAGYREIIQRKQLIIKMKHEKMSPSYDIVKTYWPPCHHFLRCLSSESRYSRKVKRISIRKWDLEHIHFSEFLLERSWVPKSIRLMKLQQHKGKGYFKGLTTIFVVTWGWTKIRRRYSINHPWATCDGLWQIPIFWRWRECRVLGIVRECNVASRLLLHTIDSADFTAVW